MQPGEDPYKFMMDIGRFIANLHKLDGRTVFKLIQCVFIVVGLSAYYEIEVRMLENNPTGLERAEIERVVGNQYNRLLRQQQDSKMCNQYNKLLRQQ